MGTIAQANASEIYVGLETTWGTASTATNYNMLRVTNFRFRQRQDTVISNIINSTREPGDVIYVDVGAEGSFDFEMDLRLGTMGTSSMGPSNLFDSLFANSWNTSVLAVSSATTIATVVASNTCHWISTGSYGSVRVGDWIKATGFTTASANDGFFYVSAKTSNNDITIKNANAVAQATASTVTYESCRMVFGSTLTSYTIAQKVPTTNQAIYDIYLGMVMGGLTLNVAPGAVINGTMNWLGKNCSQTTSSSSFGTPVAVSTQGVLNPVDHVYAIYEGQHGLAETWKVASFTLNVSNDFAGRSAVGSLGAVGIRLGRASVTGQMRIYVEHTTSETGGVYDIFASYLARTERRDGSTTPGGLSIVLQDGLGTYEAFTLHEYVITDAQRAIGGNNEDLFLDISFAAQIHASTTIGASSASVAFSVGRSFGF